MGRKQKFDYFESFVKISECAVEYSKQLVAYFEKNLKIVEEGREPDIEHAIQRFEELHKIETKADKVTHKTTEAVAVEFVAPIEREDILALIGELDDLVDDLDDILQIMYMYDMHVVPKEAVGMMKVASKSCVAVNKVCAELKNFKKPGKLRPHIIEVNDCEEEGDQLYIHAMHDIFVRGKEKRDFDVFSHGRLLTSIENICDACEQVTDTVTAVIMKNS